jgi:hypothetical protein
MGVDVPLGARGAIGEQRGALLCGDELHGIGFRWFRTKPQNPSP